jgi:hypothetical protein
MNIDVKIQDMKINMGSNSGDSDRRDARGSMRVDYQTVARLTPEIKKQLRGRIRAGMLSVGDSLRQVFTHFFGTSRTPQEHTRFLVLAAPLARRIAIELANTEDKIGNSDISIADLKVWLWWLDAMDPLCSRMIDLHYFCGLSAKETAAALEMPAHAVIRDLRFAKAWLQVRLT